MRTTITALVAAAVIGATTVATSKPAKAECWGFFNCSAGGELAAPLALLSSATYGYRFSAYFGYGYPAFALRNYRDCPVWRTTNYVLRANCVSNPWASGHAYYGPSK